MGNRIFPECGQVPHSVTRPDPATSIRPALHDMIRSFTLICSSRPEVLYHSDALHVIERFTPTAPDTIGYQLTYDDPKIFTKPWTTNWQMKLHPTWKLFEQECEENNRCEGGKCSLSDAQK